MTEWADGADDEAAPYESPEPLTPPSRGGILRWAMLWYVAVNLAIGLPLLLIPVQFLSLIGVDDATAVALGGLRWVGAMLVAWAVAALMIVARPAGRAYFVTAGALQMTFGAAALLYSSFVDEQLASLWFHTLITVVFVGTAIYLWVARFRAKEAFQTG